MQLKLETSANPTASQFLRRRAYGRSCRRKWRLPGQGKTAVDERLIAAYTGAMPTLHVQLLGGFALHVDREPAPRLNQPRFQQLLAYLSLHRHPPISRQRLAFLLWPDSTEAQARTNLRNLLHRLQRKWPEMSRWVDASGTEVGWRADSVIEIDVEQLEAALRAANTAEDPGAKEGHVRRAMDLYSGDLLPDLYDDWVLQEREGLHLRFGQALEELRQLLEDHRRYAEAIDISQRLLRLDPLQENTYHHLMRLHALAGDRAAALRVYHTCVSTLERELGVAPAPQIQEEHERLLKWAGSPHLERPAARGTPLVGRRAEWRQLLSAWQRSSRGQSRLFLIAGEAGIGKTRLAEELVDQVRRQGFAAASARCYAAEGALAYAPVAKWLRSPALRSALEYVDDIYLVEAARLSPDILQQRPDLPPPGPLQEGWQRQRFLEGLVQVFAAAPHPLLLFLDDMQWSDEQTLSWLHFLLRSPLSERMLVGGAVRLGDVRRRHPLAGLLPHLAAAGRLTEIELGPLTAEESVQLAGHVVGADLPADAQTRLVRESEGHPLFLVESLRAGDEAASPNRAHPEATAPLPSTIQAVIGARLAQLSPPAHQLAGLAAVMGREFTFSLLRAASDASDDDLVQALDELWRRRIVREQGEDAYDFSHGRIRDVVYAELSRARLRLLHTRVATALEKRYAGQLDAVRPRLAAHWHAAGDRARAAAMYAQAGEQALASYLPRQALAYFTHSANLSEESAGQANAHYGRGRALFALDQFAPAIHAFEQALELAAPTAALRGKALYAIADIYFSGLYDLEAAEPLIHQAQAAAEAAQDWETVCQSLSLLGQYHSSRQGDLAQEERLIRQAQAIARRTHNRWREGRTLADLAFLQGQQSDFRGAESSARQALALLRETDDKAGVAFAWNLLGRALGGRGDYSAAFAAFAQSEKIAAAIEQRSLLAQLPNMRGWLHQQLQDFAGARALDEEGVALAQAWGKTTAEISARLNLCLDIYYTGDPEEALAALRALEPELGEKRYGYHAWRWRLRLLHAKGLCCLALGRAGETLALAEDGLTLAQSTGARKYVALNQELMGAALAMQEQWTQAASHLQTAVDIADSIEYQPLRWQARERLAQVHRHRGDGERSASLLAEAAEIIRTTAAGLDDEPLRQGFLAAPSVAAALKIGR